MDILEVNRTLTAGLSDIENAEKAAEYGNAIADCLSKGQVSTGILAVVIRGMDIDHGANFYDYLRDLSKQDLQNLWKQIKDNKVIEEQDLNGIKLIAGMLYMALTREGNMGILVDALMIKLSGLLVSGKATIPESDLRPIIMEYIVDDLPDMLQYPDWEQMKIAPEKLRPFLEYLIHLISPEFKMSGQRRFTEWLKRGLRYADEKIEKKKAEAKIPPSRIKDIKGILEHYEKVEKQFRDIVFDMGKLEIQNERQQNEILDLKKENMELRQQMKSQNAAALQLQERIQEAEKEIEERKNLNQAQVQFRADSMESLKRDIARSLKTEFEDYIETKEVPMNEMLGNIYRDKLENIMRILARKGIKVDE